MSYTYISIEGTFECKVTTPQTGWIGEQGEKCTPFIRIPVEITEGPHAGESGIWRGWLTTAAFDKTIARLALVFGFNGDLASLELGTQTLAGKPCNIQTEIEDYNGKSQCKIKWLNPPGGGHAKSKLAPERLQKILASMNDKAMAVAKAAVNAEQEAPAAAETDEPAPENDDVPF